jgi:hypothetical protein
MGLIPFPVLDYNGPVLELFLKLKLDIRKIIKYGNPPPTTICLTIGRAMCVSLATLSSEPSCFAREELSS